MPTRKNYALHTGLAALIALCFVIGGGCNGTSATTGAGGNADNSNSASSANSNTNAGNANSDNTNSSARRRRFPLNTLPTTTVSINTNKLRVWLTFTEAEHAEGLMFVPENEIADDQGMLFVFDDSQMRSFWMKNTIISLDIAFIASDGRIVKTHTMPPLTLSSFPSGAPAMFALETKAGTFARLGIKEGDTVVIPPEVFKTTP